MDAINYLKNVKRVPVGGTSAGCAIQGQYIYTAERGSVVTSQALANPYDKDITIRRDFLRTAHLDDTVTDTHYTQRGRHGRHVTFLARISTDYDVILPKGIGLDEKTSICIDEVGNAWVYGEGDAYFMIQYRSHGYYPETCRQNNPLDWYRHRQALQVHIVRGTKNGNNKFNVENWDTCSNCIVAWWFVNSGSFGITTKSQNA